GRRGVRHNASVTVGYFTREFIFAGQMAGKADQSCVLLARAWRTQMPRECCSRLTGMQAWSRRRAAGPQLRRDAVYGHDFSVAPMSAAKHAPTPICEVVGIPSALTTELAEKTAACRAHRRLPSLLGCQAAFCFCRTPCSTRSPMF